MKAAWLWCLGFFEVGSRQSMTRFAAWCSILAGCFVAVRHPEQWQTVTALVGGGGVALLTRNKPTGGAS